jgi:hypothetical protein
MAKPFIISNDRMLAYRLLVITDRVDQVGNWFQIQEPVGFHNYNDQVRSKHVRSAPAARQQEPYLA